MYGDDMGNWMPAVPSLNAKIDVMLYDAARRMIVIVTKALMMVQLSVAPLEKSGRR